MANTASAAVSVSTADVPPQHRFVDSDREQTVVIGYPAAADVYAYKFVPGRRIQITGVVLGNGDVAQATATNTTAVDVDIYTNAATPAKAHDVAAKAAATALAAEKFLALTLSSTIANTICEADEQVRIAVTVVGTQGPGSVTLRYIDLALSDEAADWTA